MIAAGLDWGGDSRYDLSRIAFSLGLLSGGAADSEDLDTGVIAQMAGPRARPVRGWQAARTPSGLPVAFVGWVDNSDEIAAELHLSGDTGFASLYGAAFERWGNAAERRLIGDYAAIIVQGPATLRLSRAPWSVHSLFWASDGTVTLAASVPRPIFAAGFPKVGNPDLYAEALSSLATVQGDSHFFEGINRTPQGAVVTIDHGKAEVDRWYDPHAIGRTRLASDADYVDAASRHLADAVRSALRPARKPGIFLSGGLDSPLIAVECMAQMAEGQKLQSFTFEPMPGDHGNVSAGHFASDRPAVEALAQRYPRLQPHFVQNEGINFAHRLEDYFLAGDAAYPAYSLVEMHGPWQAAADAGCDWLFTGEFGNQTFSNDGRWAFVEFMRRGKWIELWRVLRDFPGDDRSMLRKLAARSLLPMLPAAVRGALRTLVHGPAEKPLIRPEVMERLQIQERRAEFFGEREWFRSHEQFVEVFWRQASSGGEMVYAIEQLHGFRLRGIPRYRPLIEFCLSIPTQQFVRDGQMRWLARRMAMDKLPEAQRTNVNYGLHGVDWHQRNTPYLPEMRVELERIADDPMMSQIVDVDRAVELLDKWPDRPTVHGRAEILYPVAAAIIAGRFARYVDGRN
ncbi:asparagine synthase-related protein [Croceicoccus bisphenolivorans]|uniref:asparagine synthase-related protein n=1 Tax=Croceicoccus bisphenolivorans TaxID=1783232 RepID=UPI00082E2FF6|nr:asparagine synthase-related protein [Croceicoccus bisphenolivorans]